MSNSKSSTSQPIGNVKRILIPTWRVYPRVYYFVRGFQDLMVRFKRLTAAFPEDFQDKESLKETQVLCDILSNYLEIAISASVEIDVANIVVTTKPWLTEKFIELEKPSKIVVNICYLKVHKLEDKMMETITCHVENLKSGKDDTMGFAFWEALFIVIDVEEMPDETTAEAFRERIFDSIFANTVKCNPEDKVIFGSHGSVLQSKISYMLESEVIIGFHKVLLYLHRFIMVTKYAPDSNTEILQTHDVLRAIQAILRNSREQLDTFEFGELNKVEETHALPAEDRFLEHILDKIACLLKCFAVFEWSKKHSIRPWVCNQLLTTINFESKVKKANSKNTLHLLKQLGIKLLYEDGTMKRKKKKKKDDKDEGDQKKDNSNDFIAHHILLDISKVLSETGKTLMAAETIVNVMRKMVFEVEGYLEQTVTEEFVPKEKIPTFKKELQEKLLSLSGIQGVGTVYKSLEIHVRDTSDSRLKEEIDCVMKSFGFVGSYKIKVVEKEAVQLMADIQHENGKRIKSPFPNDHLKFREGTLGVFVEGSDNKLYALTCGHVVCNPFKDEHVVYIQDRGLRLKQFGISTKEMTIYTGETEKPLVDFAAVKVLDDFAVNCVRRAKDDFGMNRQSRLTTESPKDLVKRCVYKHGGMTGLTRGIICSSNFLWSDQDSSEGYLLMIEGLPADLEPFAQRGDSGSVVCMSEIDGDKIVVLSMLNAGDYCVDGEPKQPKYMSFLIESGLTILKEDKRSAEYSIALVSIC